MEKNITIYNYKNKIEENIYNNKLIIHKFYKYLVNDDMDNIVNLRNINNYNKCLNIIHKYKYIKNINELNENDSIRCLSAKNLCNIKLQPIYIFKKIININNIIYLKYTLKNNNIYNLLINDKIIIFTIINNDI